MPPLPVIAQRPSSTPRPLSESDRKAIAADLASSIEGEIRFGHHDRMLYATDASMYQVEPLGVIIPASIQDAIRTVEFCARRGLPILPRGGGTSLAGQCVNEAIVLDFSAHCRQVHSIDTAATPPRCTVEPGITVDDLNERLAPCGHFFAPDPATSRQANIGGCIGNNAAGARSIMFGRTSENLLAVDTLLLSGDQPHRAKLEQGAARDPFIRDITRRIAQVVQQNSQLIRDRFPRTIRRNAGYNLDLILQQMDSAGPRADSDEILCAINLAHLICGSEGTLAVTLGADLILQPLPAARGLAVAGFASLDDAIDAVHPILETSPSAVELLDDTVLDLAAANVEYKHYVELMPAPASGPLRAVLYVEYSANRDSGELEEHFAALTSLLRSIAPTARITTYTEPARMQQAWKLRKAGEPLLHGMPGMRKPITFVEDNAVPVENLSRFVRDFRAIVEKHGTRAAFWAHASVGVLHVRPFLDIHDEADRTRVQQIAVEVADLARSLGGVMSGEHGDGRARGPLLERFYGPDLMRAFREVKAIFDPRNLLNPGNIVDPGPIASIVERIRSRPDNHDLTVPPVDTYFDYDDQHGFAGAVEMCNGAGLCRKTSGGTMCPSYMALLDERHATRGRANALRLAITGQAVPPSVALHGRCNDPNWSDPETLKTLDLCLSCKACKTECPSNVDIARLKAEYTAQGFKNTRIPLKARIFGNVRTLNKLGARAPSFANWMNRQAPMRALLNRALGLAPKRSLPPFSRHLSRLLKDQPSATDAPTIALFADCFTTCNESDIGLAAARVLSAFGYRVRLIDAGCCGRAMISTGLLPQAIRTADRTLDQLAAVIDDVQALLVIEPSCLSAIKDDWLQLRLKTPHNIRQKIAAKSHLVENFLEINWNRHPLRPAFKTPEAPLLFHGHCHQKALWGNESSTAILQRLFGDHLRILDTGCCGMAGSFGYSADKYDLSMKIGELALFPEVRSARQDATLCAPGTSCRHQITDGTGRHAMHPVASLASLLDNDAT